MAPQNRNIAVFAMIIFFALCTAYSNHFHNGFHFDDSHAVQDNVYIRSLKNIPSYFSDPKMFSADPSHWGIRSVVTTTLAIDYWLGGGLNPFYFQLSTFIWYVVLCVLLFFIYRNILNTTVKHTWAPYIAIGATAWFALHTANAETINYIIARSDVLSTLCIAASFLMYIGLPNQRKRYYYIIPAFIGVFAKETVLVLVIILFFYILLFEKKLSIGDLFKSANIKHVWNAIVKVLPLFLVVLVTQIYTLSKVSAVPGISNPPFYYILTQSYVWLHYFIAFFLPMNLSADSDWTVIHNVFDERIIAGMIFVIALAVVMIKTSAKAETRPITFGLIWFAASLLPTSLVPFAEVTNDHRMFFAFVGLTLSVVTCIGLWLIKGEDQIKSHSKYRIYIGIVIFMVLTLNAYGVYQRNKVWKDEETLWLDVTVKSPQNGRGLMNYGLTQMAKGNYAVAETYFDRALAILPYYNTLYINMGVLKGAMGKSQEAEENFKKAISLSPNTFDSYVYYARYLKQKNELPQAGIMAEKALQLNPSSLMALDILMSVYNDLGLWDKLAQTASKTLALLADDAAAHTYLQAAKNHAPAIETLNQANPKLATTAQDYLNLSLVYYNQQNYDKCVDACLQALRIKPDYADAYSNMCAAYNQLRQWDKAIDACNKALKINPAHKLANGNLNWAKSQLKK